MNYFNQYVSNTYAGSGNQYYFSTEEGERRTGRVFYKIAAGGEYDYSILFSNIIDSTFADGSVSHCNLVCPSWEIHSARIGKCKHIDGGKSIFEMTVADDGEGKEADIVVSELREIYFNGQRSRTVSPGEFFSSDPIRLNFDKNDYLCLEMTFSGAMIPYHEESLLPVYVKGLKEQGSLPSW